MRETTESGETIVIEFRRFSGKCSHSRLEVCEELEQVTCKDCGERLNPFFAITKMMRLSSKWREQRARAEMELAAAKKKSRTKCQRCGEMTKVNADVTELRVVERAEEIRIEEIRLEEARRDFPFPVDEFREWEASIQRQESRPPLPIEAARKWWDEARKESLK